MAFLIVDILCSDKWLEEECGCESATNSISPENRSMTGRVEDEMKMQFRF